MSKKKIFMWSDSPTGNTGFGKVAYNLMKNVHEEFDLEILGINYFGHERYDQNKWFIYSVDASTDPYGHKKLPALIQKSNPDIIFLFQDIFNLDMVIPEILKVAPTTPIIAYYPIDGSPVSTAWEGLMHSKHIKKHFIYSKFAEYEIRKTFPNLETPLEILYHGVNFDDFHRLDDENIKDIRKTLMWQDRFVMCNVNVFQPRKFTMGTLRAGALMRYGYKECSCGHFYLHSDAYCPLNGCGPDQVISDAAPKEDVALYMHMTTSNPRAMGPLRSNLLESHALNAGWKNSSFQERNLFMLPPNKNLARDPFTEKDLNMVYNAANVNITTTSGEGFGLNLVEASACGTTTIAPYNSAIIEILADTGHLVKNCGFFTQGMDNGHMRPVVNTGKVVKALEIEYDKWIANDKKKVINEAAIENVKSRFRWEDKREQLMKAFRECGIRL